MLLFFLIALILTIITELAVAFTLGYRKKDFLGAVVLINLMTNPAANWIFLVLGYLALANWPALIIIEIAVVLIEWKLLSITFKEKKREFLRLSVIMNASSFGLGLVLSWFGLI